MIIKKGKERSRSLFKSVILIGFLFCSCQDARVLVDTNEAIAHLAWNYSDKVAVPVEVADETIGYRFSLNLRHTDSYRYSNLYILIKQIGPDGQKTVERKEFTLALPDGKWLGNGSGSLYNYQIVFRSNYYFRKKGKYLFEFTQNMRDNPLKEISDIGLRVEKNVK